MATYLSILNNLQARLRETQTSGITTTTYSTLLGQLINQAKREIEDEWDWTALRTTLTFTTSSGVESYSITGSNERSRFIDRFKCLINDTQDYEIYPYPYYQVDRGNYLATITSQSPYYYRMKGINGATNELMLDLYPTPNATDTIRVPMVVPQADLSATTDILTIPVAPVLMRAYYLALVERGEDGGTSTMEAAQMAAEAMQDAIKTDTGNIDDRDLDWIVY